MTLRNQSPVAAAAAESAPDTATIRLSADRRPATASYGVASADRLLAFPIVVTLLFALFDLLALPASTLVVAPANLSYLARILVVLPLCFGAGWVVSRRYRNDHSRPGAFVHRRAQGLLLFVKACAVFLPFGMAAGLFMYLASNTTAPLTDGRLATIDAALGFDWPAWLAFVNASPWVSALLVVAYRTTGPVLVLLFLLHSFTLREERLLELIALVAVTSLMTGVLMFLYPAAGAYAFFRPDPESFSNFSTDAGMWHYAALTGLRSGEPFTYLASQTTGLVTFPSFHTVLGIITAYSVRGIRWVGPMLLMVNAIMIASTLPEGGHHLIDLIAGFAIALVGIACVRAGRTRPDQSDRSITRS